ncbi:hypothetical protein ACOI1C_12595 [Bacillus sp. DJP31]|uniref:TIGR03943 family putative permease subunit n=1 Tax=Bacillus sp. DJP31 TaxID=3409789 RepID=UPI003BB66248
MKKTLVILTALIVFILTALGTNLILFKEDEKTINQDKANAYLKDPKSYLEKLNEEEQPKEEHDSHGLSPEYYESLKNEYLLLDKLVFTDENFTSLMYVIDRYYESFVGEKIELIGFIYREEGFLENQFVVGRRGVEEREAIHGLLSTASNAIDLDEDQWVKVSGTLSKTDYLGKEVAYLQIDEVVEIEEPANPDVHEPE